MKRCLEVKQTCSYEWIDEPENGRRIKSIVDKKNGGISEKNGLEVKSVNNISDFVNSVEEAQQMKDRDYAKNL